MTSYGRKVLPRVGCLNLQLFFLYKISVKICVDLQLTRKSSLGLKAPKASMPKSPFPTHSGFLTLMATMSSEWLSTT